MSRLLSAFETIDRLEATWNEDHENLTAKKIPTFLGSQSYG